MSNSTVSTSDASDRTIARRNKIIDRVRDVVSGGDSAAQLREEVKHLSKAERQELLHSGGFRLDVPAEQGLAMKADLGLPWNKFNHFRWLNQWGISLSSEKRQRKVARTLLGDNLEAEAVPLTFPLKKSGGEEVRAVAYCYVPDLLQRVFHHQGLVG